MDSPLTIIRAKPFAEETRARLAEYRDENQLTLVELAKQLDTNSTQVSKYLSGKPEGDVLALEAVIEDVVNSAPRRKETLNELFTTPISRTIASVFEDIRATNDVGLIFAGAGLGKTCGLQLYAAEHPTVILLTATAWKHAALDVQGMLFNSISNRSWDGRTKRGDFVCRQLTHSNRLVIVDNAQRFKTHALAWLFDFHDATGCPLALVGNPELLDEIRKNDQHFSRIGLKKELKPKAPALREITQRIVEHFTPEAGGALDALALQVAMQQGHFRAVRKQLLLARKIREKEKVTWPDAFRAAHLELVRDYPLE